MTEIDEAALELHRRLRGKVAAAPKAELTAETLELLYTPGVGTVSRALAEDPAAARELTGIGNAVAVVSDGSAVLGLGDEGPVASLPVLEGKALLFRALANIDAVPLALDVDGPDELVAAVRALAPAFGAVNLEDIAAPACFEVERRLRDALSIPVIHDDQHGTAVVVLAALINAARVTGRELAEARCAGRRRLWLTSSRSRARTPCCPVYSTSESCRRWPARSRRRMGDRPPDGRVHTG